MLKRVFNQGKMNKNLDERELPQGEYRDALNVRAANSEGSDVGAIENTLGNEPLTFFNFGANAKCVGALSDEAENKIYFFVKSDSVSALMEWDHDNKVLSKVLYDTRAGDANVLNLDPDYIITGLQLLIDSDNGVRFLAWVDNNEPRKINIEQAKGFGDNGFTEEDILLIQAPPMQRPEITLTKSDNEENFMKESFLMFAYRYKYSDNEYSALSPFSEVAFEPGTFRFDYSTSANTSMVNKYNQVLITFNTGGKRVKGIDVVFKESGTDNLFLIESYDKEDPAKGLEDNQNITLSFHNNKTFKAMPSDELGRLFDRVPRQAHALEIMDNRLIMGNYLEDYNLVDVSGNKIHINLHLDNEQTDIEDKGARGSMKSNRDYEVGIVYLDKYGRMTSVLTSENNTTFIKNRHCDKENKLVATIRHRAPYFAEKYRFFVKHNGNAYETLSPTRFFPEDVFVWVKMEGDDVLKIEKGQFIFVKADSTGILNTAVQAEILDIKYQDANFLEEDETITDIKQPAGDYFKIKPSGFSLDINQATTHTAEAKGFASRNNRNHVLNNQDYIEDSIYYGVDGLDDAVSSGTYTGDEDIRYIIEIDTVGATDTFRWSDDDGSTFSASQNCSTSPTSLSNGVTVSFGATTGHDIEDKWIISAKSKDRVTTKNYNKRAWVPFQGKPLKDEVIKGGSTILLTYEEKFAYKNAQLGVTTGYETEEVIEKHELLLEATQDYANIEEWFYGDNIIEELQHPTTIDDVVFRRGTARKGPPYEAINVDPAEQMWMLFQSERQYDGGDRVSVFASIEIVEFDGNIIFETKPKNFSTDRFYEIGQTYDIVNGEHQGIWGDTSQSGSTPATINLDVFNCFAWFNGYESYKLRDKFNAKSFDYDTRPLATVHNYRENRRISSLIYGGRYEQSTNYNALNEFNPSTIHFLDLDDKYGEIGRLLTRSRNVVVFQEDKITPVGYKKGVLYNQAGEAVITKTDDILTELEAYAGQYGISKNPESVARRGAMIYFTDVRRGVVCRLSRDGITEISRYGMTDYFRDDFSDNRKGKKLGAYDPYHGQYVLHGETADNAGVLEYFCGSEVVKYKQTEPFTYTFIVKGQENKLEIDYLIEEGTATVSAVYNGTTYNGAQVNDGTIAIDREDMSVKEVQVTVTPQGEATFRLLHQCYKENLSKVKVIVLNEPYDAGASQTHSYKLDGSIVFEENHVFGSSELSVFQVLEGPETLGVIPADGELLMMGTIGDEETHKMSALDGNRMGYLISTNDYGQGDVDTILGAATFLTQTSAVENGEKASSVYFTVDKPTSDHIVYLVFDYRDYMVNAVSDSRKYTNGGYLDINVLDNDTYGGDVTIAIETQPTNGSARVLPNNKIRYNHNGANTDPDQFDYRITTDRGTDTATIFLTVDDTQQGGGDPGGGEDPPPQEGESFLISLDGYASDQTACSSEPNTIRYHNGAGNYPNVGDVVYEAANMGQPLNGGGNWYIMDSMEIIKVDINGEVLQRQYCAL